ncbi:MAG: inositol monophosphatase family protein [Eubacterium sp.]|nr:inositol monophosphatase family protein [Eubacterium sp.]
MYETELEIAKKAVFKAGEYLKNCSSLHVDAQEGKDIKLSADKESERILVEGLSQTGYAILSEECGEVYGESEEGLHWIIDPLDGTANYWKGMKELCCVSVALWKKEAPVLGVVYRFTADELFWGVVNEGAFCNGQPVHTSAVQSVSDAVLATGFAVRRDYCTESLTRFVRQVQRFKKVRMLGAAAIMGTFVGAGRVDAYMEDEIMLWDIAAAAAIVQAAGGMVTVQILDDYKCICKCFANTRLKEDYDAEGV